MITIYDARTNTALGTLDDQQFKELSGLLEEEGTQDRDYYINQDTVEMFETAGVSAPVLALLRQAVAATGEADIRWTRA